MGIPANQLTNSGAVLVHFCDNPSTPIPSLMCDDVTKGRQLWPLTQLDPPKARLGDGLEINVAHINFSLTFAGRRLAPCTQCFMKIEELRRGREA